MKKKTKELDWEKWDSKKRFIEFKSIEDRDMCLEWINQILTRQRTELLEEIKDIEIGEADGWELARKFNCCPGDDMADAYNQALKDVIKLIKKL